MAPRSSALAPVPAFLGESCPLGCSLSAPATGGFSVVSTVLMYAAGSEEEKGVGGLLHGDTIAQLFVFCKGGVAGAPDSGVRLPMGVDGFVLACALLERRVRFGVRPSSTEGLAWRARLSVEGPAWRAPLSAEGPVWRAPLSAEGLAWPMPPSRPLRPPTFLGTGGNP